ncbi:hypothetical protein ACFV0O_00185 [Kitasatospora sp. NPDC059577]
MASEAADDAADAAAEAEPSSELLAEATEEGSSPENELAFGENERDGELDDDVPDELHPAATSTVQPSATAARPALRLERPGSPEPEAFDACSGLSRQRDMRFCLHLTAEHPAARS